MNGHYCRCCGATDRAIETSLLACYVCVEELRLDRSHQREEMIRLYREGHGMVQVASIVGSNYKTVRDELLRAHVPLRRVGEHSPVTRERQEART